MHRLLRMTLATALGLFVLASGREAKADMETFTATLAQSTTDFTLPLAIQGFDTSLGILTNVEITWAVKGDMAGTVTNNAAGAQNFSVTENSQINLYLGTASGTLLDSPTLSASQTYTGLGSGATAAFGPYSPTAQGGPSDYGSGAIFNGFISPGNIDLTVQTFTGTTTLGGGGNILNAIATTAGGTLTVTYTYTTVPEPSSIALSLVGACVFGTGALVRRRRKAAL